MQICDNDGKLLTDEERKEFLVELFNKNNTDDEDLFDYQQTDESSDDEDSSDEDDINMFNNNNERFIYYIDNVRAWSHIQKIRYNELNEFNFSKNGLFEVLGIYKHNRLYFDIDDITTIIEYDEFISWCDSLKCVFGPYAIGGYTNDINFHNKYGFKYIQTAKKVLSFHIVYYTTKLSNINLIEIFTSKINNEHIYQFNKHIDTAVYKLNHKQLMRHILSNKKTSYNEILNNTNGNIITNNSIYDLCVTPRGTEYLVHRDDAIKVFKPNKELLELRKQQVHKTNKQYINADNEQYIDNIKLITDINALSDILAHVDPNHENIWYIIPIVSHSPFYEDDLYSVLYDWYSSRVHKTPESFRLYHYEYTESNKWFNTLIKNLINDDNIKNELKTKYIIYKQKIYNEDKQKIYNEDKQKININYGTNQTTTQLKYLNFETLTELIEYLRYVVGYHDDRYIIRTNEIINNISYITLKEYSYEKAKKTLSSYIFEFNVKDDNDTIKQKKYNCWNIIKDNWRLFEYDDINYGRPNNEPNVINMFSGFVKPLYNEKYKESLDKFLQHIKTVICLNNDIMFDYFIKWYAMIYQKQFIKTGSVMIIQGQQGCGKSTVIEVISAMFKEYGFHEVSGMDKIFGRFNSILLNKVYININEAPSYDEKKAYINNLKSIVTCPDIAIERKGMDIIQTQSFVNFTISTNEHDPLQDEFGSRRLIYFKCDNKYVGDNDYFNNLRKNIYNDDNSVNVEFVQMLCDYFNNIDITGFNPEKLIMDINNNITNDNNYILFKQYNQAHPICKYIIKHYKEFSTGVLFDNIELEGKQSQKIKMLLNQYCQCVKMTSDQYNYIIKNHSLYMDNVVDPEFINYDSDNISTMKKRNYYILNDNLFEFKNVFLYGVKYEYNIDYDFTWLSETKELLTEYKPCNNNCKIYFDNIQQQLEHRATGDIVQLTIPNGMPTILFHDYIAQYVKSARRMINGVRTRCYIVL